MENKERIEMDIADSVMERPVGFNIGSRSFFIYPPTLGKTYLLARLFKELDANQQIVATNPYMEAIRLCNTKKDIVCRILSYSTFNRKKDIFNNTKIAERDDFFCKNLDLEELATLLVLILTSDNLETYINHFGIDKERKERKRIADIKKDNGSITFGGNSVYGTLIDFACQRYGWTMDYVVWGISHTNLRMLMADAINTIYLSTEERKQLNIFDNKEYINADDPKNEELINKILGD
nr:hypothetical protein [uncultured Bacteroides sp.]